MRSLISKGIVVLKNEGPRSFTRKLAKKILRREVSSRPKSIQFDDNRKLRYPIRHAGLRFSMITGIYDKSDPIYFRELAESIRKQTYSGFEWIIIAQGKLDGTLRQDLDDLRADSRVRIYPTEENRGIIGWMREALSHAEGEYVIPIDGDDLVTEDLLQVFASVALKEKCPSLIYGDEIHLSEGRLFAPFYRPKWDRSLNWASSYVWHPICFKREDANTLGVYSDDGVEFCHDWDTVFRFESAKKRIFHVPEVLYFWRFHKDSSTNTEQRNEKTCQSQKHLLERELKKASLLEKFSVEPCPIDRGAFEWKLERSKKDGVSISVVITTSNAKDLEDFLKKFPKDGVPLKKVIVVKESDNCGSLPDSVHGISLEIAEGLGATAWVNALKGIETELVACFDSRASILSDTWYWESLGQLELNPKARAVTARILDEDSNVIGGDDLFGWENIPRSPFYGKSKHYHGPIGYATKPRRADCLNSVFFLAKADSLKKALPEDLNGLCIDSISVWVSRIWIDENEEIVFDPYIEVGYQKVLPFLSISPSVQRKLESRYGHHLNLESKLGPVKGDLYSERQKYWNQIGAQ